MSDYDFDLFIIGAGSGGVRASRMAAQAGARVAIAEDTYLGGTCVNVGCVPKKLFVYGAHVAEEVEAAAGFGWRIDRPEFDWPTLRDNKTREIERLNGVYRGLLKRAGVTLFEGVASLAGPHAVRVNGRDYKAEKILIATGSWPVIPNIPGREFIISSNEAFYLEQFPASVLVLGGGYIAVEFAGIFNGLGAATELIYRGPQILRGFDDEVRDFTAARIAQKGIRVTCETNIAAVNRESDGSYRVSLTDGSERRVECVMAATGRQPRVAGLGLENTGVQLTKNDAIQVDENFQTHEAGIYAIGDVIDRFQLTPVALAEAMALTGHLYRNQPITLDYRVIPTTVFCQPNIGCVGLTEQEAIEQGHSLRIYTSSFRPMKHTLSGINEKTFMKLVVDDASDRVLGCHMVGAEAGEIIQGIAIAMQMGARKSDFDATIGIHPTAAEEFVTMRELTRRAG